MNHSHHVRDVSQAGALKAALPLIFPLLPSPPPPRARAHLLFCRQLFTDAPGTAAIVMVDYATFVPSDDATAPPLTFGALCKRVARDAGRAICVGLQSERSGEYRLPAAGEIVRLAANDRVVLIVSGEAAAEEEDSSPSGSAVEFRVPPGSGLAVDRKVPPLPPLVSFSCHSSC